MSGALRVLPPLVFGSRRSVRLIERNIYVYRHGWIVIFSGLSVYYLGFVTDLAWAAVLTALVASYGVYYILKLPTRRR